VTTVDTPGVYDLSAEVYQADPVPGGSLSHSGARRLLPPSCPALYRHWADSGSARTTAFDVGHAAHRLVLGTGTDIVVVDAPDWRTKAAREARDETHAAGATPLLRADYEEVEAMAAALREHPVAAALFAPGAGEPERSLFWTDAATGVWLRARLDWLPAPRPGRMIIADYKTAKSASPTSLDRSMFEYGYFSQAAWYQAGALALGLAEDPAFVFVVQEKTPPFLVTVVQPNAVALRLGRDLNRQAIELYAQCTATGRWPGYSDDVELVGLPSWVEARYLQEIS
jgi:hypothetical protein